MTVVFFEYGILYCLEQISTMRSLSEPSSAPMAMSGKMMLNLNYAFSSCFVISISQIANIT
jgi:hypothetical protein